MNCKQLLAVVCTSVTSHLALLTPGGVGVLQGPASIVHVGDGMDTAPTRTLQEGGRPFIATYLVSNSVSCGLYGNQIIALIGREAT